MDQGGPRERIFLEPYVFPQSKGRIRFARNFSQPFQEASYRFSRGLGFLGLRKPVKGIQGIALHELWEEIPKVF
jgi:hypothetical protein